MPKSSDDEPTKPHPAIELEILPAVAGLEPRQIPMFARKAVIEYPKITQSADASGEVEADDGHRYVTKPDSAFGHRIRASEWICTHIAEQVHIGAPTPMVIERSDGTTEFGSRIISGVADNATTQAFLTTQSEGNLETGVKGVRRIFSGIFALDMFLFNDDRHFGNYLSVDVSGVRRMYAFDFSRALFFNWPLDGFPAKKSETHYGTHTRNYGATLMDLHGFDFDEAYAVIDRLEKISLGYLKGVVSQIPSDWLSQEETEQFFAWWDSSARAEDRKSVV